MNISDLQYVETASCQANLNGAGGRPSHKKSPTIALGVGLAGSAAFGTKAAVSISGAQAVAISVPGGAYSDSLAGTLALGIS